MEVYVPRQINLHTHTHTNPDTLTHPRNLTVILLQAASRGRDLLPRDDAAMRHLQPARPRRQGPLRNEKVMDRGRRTILKRNV